MERMVVGFLFDIDEDEVLLIRKNRPEWQKGKLNGIGGHIEDGETPVEAMTREFEEEAGAVIATMTEDWKPVAEMESPDWHVSFFMTYGPAYYAEAQTDEYLESWSIKDLPEDVIPNLHWLIPLALDDNHGLHKPVKVVYE